MRTCRKGHLLSLLIALALVCAAVPPAAAGTGEILVPRLVRPKPLHSPWRSGWHKDLVVLKCAEGSGVRLRSGQLVSINGTPVQGLQQVLGNHGHPAVRRLFSQTESALEQERNSGEQLSGRELADLNLYFLLTPVPGADPTLLVDDLNFLDVVELAYFEPLAEPGAIHPDAAGDLTPEGQGTDTPDFSGLQSYLEPAPLGLDAGFAWQWPGGRGEGVRIGLVERGLNPDHEDLPTPQTWAGKERDLHHGTAVLGEILGRHNGFGVAGIAPQAELHVSLFNTEPPFPVIADAILTLKQMLRAGDVMLIEYHARGPESGETCPCSCVSFEYLPLEYWQANFDAIATITANQVVCVEIAGNGSMNLDHPRYQGAFQRHFRDSSAILVGAALPGSRKPECWTNYGSRLDLHGHGSGIVTAGYGVLYNGGPDATYTDSFGGTSGAGAMTAGAVCALQGWFVARTGEVRSAGDLLLRLRETGTSQGTDYRQVGPLPDLSAAIGGLPHTIGPWQPGESP